MGVASLSALGGKNVCAESVQSVVGVRCPDLGGKMRPLLGCISSPAVSISFSVCLLLGGCPLLRGSTVHGVCANNLLILSYRG